MDREDIYSVEGMSSEMLAASREARRTFKFFWREMSWEYRRIIPGVGLSAVKVPFANDSGADDEPTVEHMWITDIQFDGDTVAGTLLNQPQWVTTVAPGDDVSIPLDEIGDWMYAFGERVFGAYTVNEMRRNMSAIERRQHDSAWGLDFGDPNAIEVVETPRPPRVGLLGRLLGKKPPPTPAFDPEAHEHPMSENSRESYREQLGNDASSVEFVDDDGWTLLQRDALAGNLAPVEAFLEFGADPTAKTPSGYTAIDLARKMDWPRVVEALRNAGG